MKNIFFVVISLILFSCGNPEKNVELDNDNSTVSVSSHINYLPNKILVSENGRLFSFSDNDSDEISIEEWSSVDGWNYSNIEYAKFNNNKLWLLSTSEDCKLYLIDNYTKCIWRENEGELFYDDKYDESIKFDSLGNAYVPLRRFDSKVSIVKFSSDGDNVSEIGIWNYLPPRWDISSDGILLANDYNITTLHMDGSVKTLNLPIFMNYVRMINDRIIFVDNNDRCIKEAKFIDNKLYTKYLTDISKYSLYSYHCNIFPSTNNSSEMTNYSNFLIWKTFSYDVENNAILSPTFEDVITIKNTWIVHHDNVTYMYNYGTKFNTNGLIDHNLYLSKFIENEQISVEIVYEDFIPDYFEVLDNQVYFSGQFNSPFKYVFGKFFIGHETEFIELPIKDKIKKIEFIKYNIENN